MQNLWALHGDNMQQPVLQEEKKIYCLVTAGMKFISKRLDLR